ncbi:phage holin family protein [soil metagenome]
MTTTTPTTGRPVPLSKTTQWSADPVPAEPSIGELVQAASTHFSTLLRGEIELAKTEVTASAKKGIKGAVFFGAAAVVALFSLVFLLISLAEGLVALGVWRWLAYLIVWVMLIVIAGVSVVIGMRAVKKVSKPERTIETIKDSKQLLQRGPVY